MIKLYSYNKFSEGAKLLANGLGIKRIKHEGSKYRPKPNDFIINWGSGNLPPILNDGMTIVINKPECVRVAANKLHSFNLLSQYGVPIPKYTANKEYVDFDNVVVRHKLTGKAGEGIEIVGNDQLPDAPLYVQYIPKKHEYRVHVIANQVVDVQIKKRKLDVPDGDVNWKVRNLKGGFIFARDGVKASEELKKIACGTVKAIGLDFGAVDIIYNERSDKYYVLEVNTAPGLVNTTLDNYVDAFKKWLL